MTPSEPPPGDPRPEDQLDLVDLEDHAREHDACAPRARRYRIRIDREKYIVEVPTMTGREILALAGHTPKSHKIYQKRRGCPPDPVGPDEVVDFRARGVERFQTIPIDPREGLAPRRQFELLAEDEDALEERGLLWEAAVDGKRRILVLHSYPVHPGYNVAEAKVILVLPAGYDDTQIDMVFFNPPLARADGQAVKALSPTQLDGETYQQWSRHRTPANPWRPGVDGVRTHLLMVDDWLAREFKNR